MQLISYELIKDSCASTFIVIFDPINKLRSRAYRTNSIEDFLSRTLMFFDDDNAKYNKIITSGNWQYKILATFNEPCNLLEEYPELFI